ncbi:hypothetical protein MSG28_001215 [Choristoneura fumiferana]|uniref:Uncharacterized protein n=1 Tax=Choristoneura fumiferana TaxID=7141 RepID=A0ACC0K4I8_CHOFU|nr:hypothetical protein MSG28_001215 [Choristoneura fumiferana]
MGRTTGAAVPGPASGKAGVGTRAPPRPPRRPVQQSVIGESRSGLNRYYRQAWEELHEATGAKGRRNDREAPKDGSELVVSDVYPAPRDKRRHHHHHHHRQPRHPDWHSPHRPQHNHKPRY